MKKLIFLIFTFLFLSVSGQETIKPEEAANYVNKNVTVCGKVASAYYASELEEKPTFLNLDKPYPDQIFTIFILPDVRSQFENKPEVFYLNKEVCVTGKITLYNSKPQIVLEKKGDLKLK